LNIQTHSHWRTGSLAVHFHYARSKLHESFSKFNHDTEDATTLSIWRAPEPPSTRPVVLSPAYVKAVLSFLSSAHATLDAFLTINDESLRTGPVVTYIRALYMMKRLLKLNTILQMKEHELSKIIDNEDLRLAFYFEQIRKKLAHVSGDTKCKISTKILGVLNKLGDHWRHKECPVLEAGEKTVDAPLQDLRPTSTDLNKDLDTAFVLNVGNRQSGSTTQIVEGNPSATNDSDSIASQNGNHAPLLDDIDPWLGENFGTFGFDQSFSVFDREDFIMDWGFPGS